MRKHIYLVTEHENDDRVGGVSIFDERLPRPLKNQEGKIRFLDKEAGEFKIVGQCVGLGYADFEDEDDFEARIGDVIQDKLREIDEEHLEKARIELEAIEA